MSSYRLPGPVCTFLRDLGIDAGTLCRAASPAPSKDTEPAKTFVEPPVWDADPDGLLDDPNLNPDLAKAATAALKYAVNVLDLRARVHETYRAPERSDALYKNYRAGKGGRAAPAWTSCHNYGLAMDVWIIGESGKTDWTRKLYETFNIGAANEGLVWGGSFNDYDHWEYHPSWKGGAGGTLLLKNKELAMKEALKDGVDTHTLDWLPYFWKLAGA